MNDTFSAALLLTSIGFLLAGVGVFFVGFAQFIKSDREHRSFFRKS